MYIGIIGAMEEEIKETLSSLEQSHVKTIMGISFHIGKLYNRDVVVAPCLEGKVNAAICTQTLLQNFEIEFVLNVGVAGGIHPQLAIGGIAISSSTVEFDQDTTALGYELGYTFGLSKVLLECRPTLVQTIFEKVKKQDNTMLGVIASSDTFVSKEETKTMLQEKFNAIAVDMESASIHHVCQFQQIPFCAIRAISDTANEIEYQDFVAIAVKQLTVALKRVLG